MRFSVILAVLLILAVGTSAIFNMPVFRQCDSQWATQFTPYGGNMCQQGSFMTSLAMALNGTRVSSDISTARVPMTTPSTLLNHISNINVIMKHRHDTVDPELVELMSSSIHFQGEVSFADACTGVVERDSFFLVTTQEHGQQRVSVLAYYSDDGAIIHDPVNGRVVLHPSIVTTVHEFSVAFNKRDILANRALKLGRPALAEVVPTGTPIIPFEYPEYYRQCDPKWGPDVMSNRTVCEVGCLMNSVTVALHNHGLRFKLAKFMDLQVIPDPGSFNQWLRENNGYSQDNLQHVVVPKVCESGYPTPCEISFTDESFHRTNDISIGQMQEWLKSYRVMIANVKNGGHFVIAIGWDSENPDIVFVRDSGSSGRTWYSFSEDIVGWRVYDMKGQNSPFPPQHIASIDKSVSLDDLAASIGL